MKDIEGIEDIRLFVDEFYGKVRENELIGPVFNAAVLDWPHHLGVLYAFWNAALFGVPGFRGNPFAKHASLQIGPKHFEQWLLIFSSTIDRHFNGIIAEEAKKRAKLMADMFLNRLIKLDGDPSKVVA